MRILALVEKKVLVIIRHKHFIFKSPKLAAIDITQAVTLIQSRATTFYINVEFQSSMDLVMRLGMWTVDFNLGEDLLVDLSP